MRENRLSGSEGGATSSRPYPYRSSSPFGTKTTLNTCPPNSAPDHFVRGVLAYRRCYSRKPHPYQGV
jgi:hypothetical protein